MIIAGLLSASCESVFDRDRGRYDGREAQLNLTGTWYVNGDRDQRAEIVSTPSGLEASRSFSTRIDIGIFLGLETGKGLSFQGGRV